MTHTTSVCMYASSLGSLNGALFFSPSVFVSVFWSMALAPFKIFCHNILRLTGSPGHADGERGFKMLYEKLSDLVETEEQLLSSAPLVLLPAIRRIIAERDELKENLEFAYKRSKVLADLLDIPIHEAPEVTGTILGLVRGKVERLLKSSL